MTDRTYFEAVVGQKAADLATVCPGSQGARTDMEETSPNDLGKSDSMSYGKRENLRAILRAPEVVQDLYRYREGRINQTTAAKLGPMELRTLNSAFKRVVRNDYWRLRYDPHRNCLFDYRGKTFADFLRDPYPGGMDTDVDTLRKVLDAEANLLLEVLLVKAVGAPPGNDNAKIETSTDEGNLPETNGSKETICLPPPQRGNTRQGAIRKLHRAALGKRRKNDGDNFPTPEVAKDLLDKIGRGETTCNRALESLGYRPDPTPLEIVLKNLPKLDEAGRLVVARELSALCKPEESP